MVVALKELSIRGDFRTTVEYLIKLLETESFQHNSIDTGWLDRLISEKMQVCTAVMSWDPVVHLPGTMDFYPVQEVTCVFCAGGASRYNAGNCKRGSSCGWCQSEEQRVHIPAFSGEVKTRHIVVVKERKQMCAGLTETVLPRPGARCCQHTHYSTLLMWSWSMKAQNMSWQLHDSLQTPMWSSWTTLLLRWMSIDSAMEVFCCLMMEAVTLPIWKKRWTGERK